MFLVVDEDALTILAISRVISDECVIALNVTSAISAARLLEPELILIDPAIVNGDATNLINELREASPLSVIALFTSRVLDGEEVAKSGLHYIYKGGFGKLVDKIKRLLSDRVRLIH